MRGFLAVKIALMVVVLLSSASPGRAVTNDEVRLAGEGRFEELAQRIDARGSSAKLTTADWHALCYAQSRVKRYRELFDCLSRLAESAKGRDRSTRLFGLDDVTPAINILRGEALLDLAQYAEAVEQGNRALEWFEREKSDDRDIQIGALTVLALASALKGDPQTARSLRDRIQAVNTGRLAGDQFASLKTLSLAKVNLAMRQYAEAYKVLEADRGFEVRSAIERLLHGARQADWMWQALPRLYMIHKALLGSGRVAEAKKGFDELLAAPQTEQNGEIHWMLLFDRGQIAEQEGDLDAAVEFYRRATEVIERMRSSINTEVNKIGFVGDKQEVYARGIGVLFKLRRFDDAGAWIDRAKSRALVDLLASRQEITATRYARNAASRVAVAAAVSRHRTAETMVVAQLSPATLGERRAALGVAVTDLRRVAPDLASLVTTTSLAATELRALAAPDEVIVQYYQRGELLYASVIGEHIAGFALDGKGLADEVRRFREAVANTRQNPSSLAVALHQRLIAPIEKSLSGKRLLIVPHGALHYVPFAALSDGKTALIERFSLRVLPSVSVIRFLRKPSGAAPSKMLALGNPDLRDSKLDLPGAEREARQLFDGIPESRLLVRGEATKAAFRELAPAYRFVHIAAHGEFEAAAPLSSRLYFARSATDDGELTAGDVYSIELDADLVTLSACETGLGEVMDGDEVVGLMRGFLYAGASSVVGSLWRVSDATTTTLMLRFYDNLKRMPKDDALRDAQLNLRKTRAHPFYWAAFYLTGESR
jgi:CHAT domain-containing protein